MSVISTSMKHSISMISM